LSAAQDYDIGLVVCLGIAGALSPDLNIGDACFSRAIIDVVDNAKTVEGDGATAETNFSPTHYSSPLDVVTAIIRNKLNPSSKPGFIAWQAKSEEEAKRLLPGEFSGKSRKLETIVTPTAIEGSIACGAVCASPKYRKKLQDIDRRVLAIDTESGGIFSAAALKQIPALTVRSISDYADGDKSKLEQDTHGSARKIATTNAATFLYWTLASDRMRTWFLQARSKRESAGEQYSLLGSVAADVLGETILAQGARFDAKLRELAPSYALQVKGYRLPVPRVRLLDDRSGIVDEQWGDPIDVRDALRQSRVLIVTVPRDYPDNRYLWQQARPTWLIGRSLSGL